jgi:hypothetical protein
MESIHRQTVDEDELPPSYRLATCPWEESILDHWSSPHPTVIRTVDETEERLQVDHGLATCVRAASSMYDTAKASQFIRTPGTQRRRRDRLGDKADGRPMPMPTRTARRWGWEMGGRQSCFQLYPPTHSPVLHQDMMVLPGRHYSASPSSGAPPWNGKTVLDMMPSSLSLQGPFALASCYLKRSVGYLVEVFCQ